jgi:AcrR family transcriptional regulator
MANSAGNNGPKDGRRTKSELRRLQILDAALHCFHQNGFTATTMEDIRRRSGASTGSVYHHFKNKEELGVAVFVEGLRLFYAGFIEELEKHPEPKDGIAAVIGYYLKLFDGHPDWIRYLISMQNEDFPGPSNEAVSHENRQFVRYASRWLEKHVESGAIKKIPLDIFLSIVLGPCNEFGRYWLKRSKRRTDPQIAVVELSEAAWRAVANDGNDAKKLVQPLLDAESDSILFWTGAPGSYLKDV